MVKRIMGLILTGTMIMSLPACGKANTDTSKTRDVCQISFWDSIWHSMHSWVISYLKNM